MLPFITFSVEAFSASGLADLTADEAAGDAAGIAAGNSTAIFSSSFIFSSVREAFSFKMSTAGLGRYVV